MQRFVVYGTNDKFPPRTSGYHNNSVTVLGTFRKVFGITQEMLFISVRNVIV